MRQPKIYATLRKQFTTQALVAMRFTADGSRMVKRGMCRTEKAVAHSTDGVWWRVTPLVRGWKH